MPAKVSGRGLRSVLHSEVSGKEKGQNVMMLLRIFIIYLSLKLYDRWIPINNVKRFYIFKHNDGNISL